VIEQRPHPEKEPLLSVAWARVTVFIVAYFVVALILFLPLTMVLLATGVVTLDELESMSQGNFAESGVFLFAIALATAVYGILYTIAYILIVDRSRPSSYGLSFSRGWFGGFWLWGLVGAAVLGIVFLIELAYGLVDISSMNFSTAIVKSLVYYFFLFVLVALSEEFMFRGYILQTSLKEGGEPPVWTWVLISAAVFSLFHSINPGYSVISFLNTLIIGIGLCLLLFVTKSLWAPIGFHFGWNLSLAWLYSLNVSGLDMRGVLDTETASDYGLLTGGDYGPEGGFICAIVVFLLTVALVPKALSQITQEERPLPWLRSRREPAASGHPTESQLEYPRKEL
jgi:membrane protease YdiL (CAAX protease family)